jgi:hypothetical protein
MKRSTPTWLQQRIKRALDANEHTGYLQCTPQEAHRVFNYAVSRMIHQAAVRQDMKKFGASSVPSYRSDDQ